MTPDNVECSKCGAVLESEDELMVHSIENHTPGMANSGGTDRGGSQSNQSTTEDLSPEMADKVLRILEQRAETSDTLLVRYGRTYLLVTATVVIATVGLITLLLVSDILSLSVYMFMLGVFFGIILSYVQGLLQAVRREYN